MKRKAIKKVRLAIRLLTRFLIINFFIFILSAPFVTFYGPFNNLRYIAVGSITTSMHPFIARWFLSQAAIDQIAGNQNNRQVQSNARQLFRNTHSNLIKLEKIKGARFTGYILTISDPTRIKVATSSELGRRGETVSTMAGAAGAIAAVNAGGFDDPSGTGTGAVPIGVVVHHGNFSIGRNLSGYVDVIGFTSKGVLITGRYTVAQLKHLGIAEAVSFENPALIVNGRKMITHGDGGWGIGPRTAIGQCKDGKVLILVIDGRQPGSIGASLLDCQNILYQYGCYTAANLDGGSSTTLYYNNKVVNHLADPLGERSIPTAFVVK